MTDLDYQTEQHLRLLLKEKGRRETALILADFYEQHGQPSRAALWRIQLPLRVRRDADLIVRDPRKQRRSVMWLLSHFISKSQVARALRSSDSWASVLIGEVDDEICAAANAERHNPTMQATRRLQAAHALPRRFEVGRFELGEVPPESWPVTRERKDDDR